MKKIAIVAWHLGEISGTSTILRNFLANLDAIKLNKQYSFLIFIKEENLINQPNITDPLQNLKLEQKNLEVDNQLEVIRVPYKNQTKQAWFDRVGKLILEKGSDLAVFFDINLPSRFDSKAFKKYHQLKTVAVIHDVMPLVLPDYYLDPLKFWVEKKKFQLAATADRIITVSDFSLHEIIKTLKIEESTITRVYNGIDDGLEVGFDEKPPKVDWSRRSGILNLGSFQNRKNVYRLAEAYLLLPDVIRKQNPLILTGKDKIILNIVKLFGKYKQSDELVILDKGSFETREALFNQGYLFVFPSLMEGFGLPLLEAQRYQLPVICGNHSSLSEVAGESAYMVDVLDPVAIRDAMMAIIDDTALHRKLSVIGYQNSLKYTGRKMAEGYGNVFESGLS